MKVLPEDPYSLILFLTILYIVLLLFFLAKLVCPWATLRFKLPSLFINYFQKVSHENTPEGRTETHKNLFVPYKQVGGRNGDYE